VQIKTDVLSNLRSGVRISMKSLTRIRVLMMLMMNLTRVRIGAVRFVKMYAVSWREIFGAILIWNCFLLILIQSFTDDSATHKKDPGKFYWIKYRN